MITKKFLNITLLGLGTALCFTAPAVLAQATAANLASQTIKLIVGYAPGGPVDTSARQFAPYFARETGATVIVENRPGAAGAIGGDAVAKSAAAGINNTLLLFYAASPTVTISPHLLKSMPFDPVKDITPIARIAAIWAVIWMGAIGVLLILFAPQALRIFTQDPEVINAGQRAIRMLGFAQAFWAIQGVCSGGMRGMGDTRSPLILFAGGLWATVGLAWVLLNTFHGGLVSVWAAFLISTPIITALMLWRFRQIVRQLK